MATLSSVLAWRITGAAEPGGLPSMGSHRVGHDWSDLAVAAVFHLCTYYIFFIHSFVHFREGTATHSFSCLENPMDMGAWCATVHGSQRVGHDWVTKHSTALSLFWLLYCFGSDYSYFTGSSAGKESAWNVGDLGSIPGLGRSPGEWKGYPLQYWPGEFHELCSPWGCKE